MYREIELEINNLMANLFTGHVKFGIEHGAIQQITFTTKLENTPNTMTNIESEIKKIYPDEKQFYGSIDYNIAFGKVLSSNYSVTLQGEQVKSRIRNNEGREVYQCKSVIVVKK